MTTTVTTTQPTVAPAQLRIHIPPAVRHMLRRLTGRIPTSADRCEAAPTGPPGAIPPGQANPPDYARGAAVWAYIAGRWLPARVTEIEVSSVLIAYEVPGTGETSSLEVVHSSHLAPRGRTLKTPEPAASAFEAAGQARATLLVHRADEHRMCKGCADLAHFCWAPCPAAREARRILHDVSARLAGAR